MIMVIGVNQLFMRNKKILLNCVLAIIYGAVVANLLYISIGTIWFNEEESKVTQKQFLTEIRYMKIPGTITKYDVETGVNVLPFKKKTEISFTLKWDVKDRGSMEKILLANGWHFYQKEGIKKYYTKDDMLIILERNENTYIIHMKYMTNKKF